MTTFTGILNGTLYGIMHWDKWDELCDHIQASGDPWFAYSVGHAVPEFPVKDAELAIALDEIRALLKREHEEDYLGIVFVDDLTSPALIKIYDPSNLGSSCGSSGRNIPPGWILSRLPPSPIASDIPLPNNRRRWWQGLLTRLADSSVNAGEKIEGHH
ncbi:MAG: hypothetical protein KKD65_00235 [Gammaproteobacteria bacterium]|jgi:hypothetical protein|nr:hypothetical protein [Gammaproteobacteria bacterium]